MISGRRESGGYTMNPRLKLAASLILFIVLIFVMIPDMLKRDSGDFNIDAPVLSEPSADKTDTYSEPDTVLEERSHMFATGNLNIRSGPGMDNEIIKVIPTGEKVQIDERGDIWYKVTYRDATGYSHSDYLSDSLGDNTQVNAVTEGFVEGVKQVNGLILVNKEHKLPAEYSPGENPEARSRLDDMLLQGEKEIGKPMYAFSGYRSYAYQENLYLSDLYNYGQEYVDKFTAKPGHSEHQTGLAFDIGGESKCWADPCFDDTEEAKWLADNAHRFGFILRYPKGKEDITGYGYESWHYRYVGEEHAVRIYEEGLSLEEYLLMQ
jgi:D-alanyl-D-alanine carboxypeptidase